MAAIVVEKSLQYFLLLLEKDNEQNKIKTLNFILIRWSFFHCNFRNFYKALSRKGVQILLPTRLFFSIKPPALLFLFLLSNTTSFGFSVRFSITHQKSKKTLFPFLLRMADTQDLRAPGATIAKKRSLKELSAGDAHDVSGSVASKRSCDPVQALANARHEFGEHGGVNMSIEASATFTVMEPETMRRMFSGELGPDRDFFIYSRHFNPTVLNLSRQMAAIEGTEAAYCTSSGMAAISSILLQACSSGGHVVAAKCLYGGTHALLAHFLPRACNITTTFVDDGDIKEVREAIREGITKVVYVESISNPTLSVANIPEICAAAHEKGAIVVVDNTFAPMVLSPARLGADVVIHSISKYISGGADIIAGAVCGPASLVNSMMDLHQGALMLLGPTMNAKVAFEVSERLPHLGLRMKEHCRRAMVFAERMKKLGLKVIYPGLEDHPHHRLLASMANPEYGFGGILCLDMETEERANRLMNLLQNYAQFGLMAVSLGYYETLMSCSGSSTSSELSEQEKESAGISPGLVRMSIGYSGTIEQRWSQFEKALNRIQDASPFNKI